MLPQILFKVVAQPGLLIDGQLALVDQEDLVTRHLQQQFIIQTIEFLIGLQNAGLNFA